MEKKREQELSVLEVLRLHREFHLPHPVPADEQEKPLDNHSFYSIIKQAIFQPFFVTLPYLDSIS